MTLFCARPAPTHQTGITNSPWLKLILKLFLARQVARSHAPGNPAEPPCHVPTKFICCHPNIGQISVAMGKKIAELEQVIDNAQHYTPFLSQGYSPVWGSVISEPDRGRWKALKKLIQPVTARHEKISRGSDRNGSAGTT